jgi:hypothetical protein
MARHREKNKPNPMGGQPPQRLRVPVRKDPDFRYVSADGAYIREWPQGLVVEFYLQDSPAVFQNLELERQQGNVVVYQAGAVEEERQLYTQVAVRLSVETALSLAQSIITRIQQGLSPQLQAPVGAQPGGIAPPSSGDTQK